MALQFYETYIHAQTDIHTHTQPLWQRGPSYQMVRMFCRKRGIRESALVVGFWGGETHQAMGKPPKVSGGRVVCG